MKSQRPTAMTLIEVLVVTAILGLFLTMVCHALVVGYRTHVKTLEKSFAYREGTVAVAKMLREIATCNRWVYPPTGSGPVEPYSTDKVAFYRNDSTNFGSAGGGVEVHYWLEPTTLELHREVESVSDPTTRVDRVVVRGVRMFRVDVQEPQVKISLQVKHIELPIDVVGVAPQM